MATDTTTATAAAAVPREIERGLGWLTEDIADRNDGDASGEYTDVYKAGTEIGCKPS